MRRWQSDCLFHEEGQYHVCAHVTRLPTLSETDMHTYIQALLDHQPYAKVLGNNLIM